MGVGPGIVHAKSWRIWLVGLLPATLNLPNGINQEAGITASYTTASHNTTSAHYGPLELDNTAIAVAPYTANSTAFHNITAM
jgi:hypothetical protein